MLCTGCMLAHKTWLLQAFKVVALAWQPRCQCTYLPCAARVYVQACPETHMTTYHHLCLLHAAHPRQVAAGLPGGTFMSSKEVILGRITAVLAAYRKYCATSSSAVGDSWAVRTAVVFGTPHSGALMSCLTAAHPAGPCALCIAGFCCGSRSVQWLQMHRRVCAQWLWL